MSNTHFNRTILYGSPSDAEGRLRPLLPGHPAGGRHRRRSNPRSTNLQYVTPIPTNPTGFEASPRLAAWVASPSAYHLPPPCTFHDPKRTGTLPSGSVNIAPMLKYPNA